MSAVSKTGHSVFFHSLVISLSVGMGSIAIPFGANAQESIVLDFSNPNVSVDFSVLEDSGVGPIARTSPTTKRTSNTSSKGHLIPGPKAPVSTLYIAPANAPSSSFVKADENTTKFKFKFVAPETPKEMSAEMPAEAPKEIPKAEPKTEVVKKEIPVAPPPPVVAAIEEKSAPELAKEELAPPPEPVAIEKPKEVVKEAVKEVVSAEPEAPKAPPPPPEPTPAPVPVTPVTETPVKLEAAPAKEIAANEIKEEVKEEKIAEPVAPPAPPPVVEVPEPPKVVAKLPEITKEAPEAPSVASLPPAGATIADGYSMRVLFEAENAKLPADAREELRGLATSMTKQEDLRLQLLAYAGGAEMSSSAARRLSLSRALAVRSYLIESGVRSTRIDVRALGNKTSDAETERVDITVIER